MSIKSSVNVEKWIRIRIRESGSASQEDLLYLDIVVRVSFGVEVLEGVDDLYGEGAGQ